MLQLLSKLLTVLGLLLLLSASPANAADVVTSEIFTSNTSGLTDEDGDDSDWIKLTNFTAAPIDLTSWHLSDSGTSLDKWAFPSVIMGLGDELILFASDKDRAVVGVELHTNFKLSSSDDELTIAFQRLQKAADSPLVVEVSTDLLSWDFVATQLSSSDNGDGTEDVVFQSPLTLSTQPRQFMRLSVRQN